MKKWIVILLALVCVFGFFVIVKTVNTNIIKEFIVSTYPKETLTIKSVDINVKKMETIAYVYDSEGVESKVWKKGSMVYSDYGFDKATSMVENELTKVLRKSGRMKYINNIEVKILEDIDYVELASGFNPENYLTIEYNDKVSDKINFAQVSYDVIYYINQSKYKNVGTYVFFQNTENDAMNLVVNSEETEVNLDIIFSRIEIVKEKKVN